MDFADEWKFKNIDESQSVPNASKTADKKKLNESSSSEISENAAEDSSESVIEQTPEKEVKSLNSDPKKGLSEKPVKLLENQKADTSSKANDHSSEIILDSSDEEEEEEADSPVPKGEVTRSNSEPVLSELEDSNPEVKPETRINDSNHSKEAENGQEIEKDPLVVSDDDDEEEEAKGKTNSHDKADEFWSKEKSLSLPNVAVKEEKVTEQPMEWQTSTNDREDDDHFNMTVTDKMHNSLPGVGLSSQQV